MIFPVNCLNMTWVILTMMYGQIIQNRNIPAVGNILVSHLEAAVVGPR